MIKKIVAVLLVASICINLVVAQNYIYAETSKELFNESYADVEGKLSSEWVKANGVDYASDGMSLYREDGDDETKQLERTFSEDAKGLVTIEYEFANINTNGSIKPVQLELKAKDSEGTVNKILIMHHADNKVKVKVGSAYKVIKTVNIDEKTSAKIVVDTVLDTIAISIGGEELSEYPLFTDMDMDQLSSIYWVLTSGKYDTGLKLYSMKATASDSTNEIVVTDEEKIQSDLDEIELTSSAAIKVDFTVPITGTNGSVISWDSNDTSSAEVDNSTGLVTVITGDSERTVSLTATAILNGKSLTKVFDITIAKKATDDVKVQSDLDEIELANAGIVKDNFTLPFTGTNGSIINWISENTGVAEINSATGLVTVTRSNNDQNVKLTATATLNGTTRTKVFNVTVLKIVDASDYLFIESYADVEGKLSPDWTTLKGESYSADCMTLYRSYTDTATKQLKRTFGEEANGMVTIEYDFANIGENNKPVQFFLKARNTENEEVTILTTQHTPTVVRVRTVSETGQVVYKNLKDIVPNQKYTAKIVVDTILDKVTLTVADQTQEYEIDNNEDLKNVSLMYWTITSDKKDVGINLYQMSASTSVSDDLKIKSDLAKIVLDNTEAIKENFVLPVSGKLGSVFTWESDKPEVVTVDNITGEAVISRMDTDQIVKLTVTSTLNGTSDSKEFQVTVRRKLSEEEEKVEKDKESLSVKGVVTTDLLLIRDGENGSKITWKSDNTSVITNKGEVTIGDEDQNVILTATLVYGSVTDTREFKVVVPKENLSSRPAQVENNMTDEEFLGIWHSETGEWIMKPKINYDYNNNSILKSVEESVKEGDYEKAKELILDYYIAKDRVIDNPSSKRNNSRESEYMLDDIYCKLWPYAKGTVSSEATSNNYDITEKIAEKVVADQKSLDFVVISLHKNQEIIFNSKEGKNQPVLTLVADGVEYKINASADSYIRGGKNGNSNYGNEEYLKALESGMPVDDSTKRIYIRFVLPELTTTANIESAQLSFYGFARSHDPNNPNESNEYDESLKLNQPAEIIICQSEEIDFKETSVKWNAPLRIRFYSFEGNDHPYGGMDYIQTNKTGMDKQFVNTYARFWHQEGLLGSYLETGDEKYAARYIRELLVYYTKVGGGDLLVKPDVRGTNTQLNAGFREQIITDSYYELIKSASMTADDNLQIMKFIYDDAEALLKPFYWERSKNNNWGMEMTVGNQSVIEAFPEFATTSENLDIIADRMSFLLGNLIRTDGAYIEGTNGYPVHVFENIYAYKKAMEELDYKVPDILESQIIRFATSFINILEPNGYIAEYGDDHYDQKPELYEEIEEIARFENDSEMLYVSTYGKEGDKPLHQSAYYPDGRWATMRDGWDEDSIFSFANWMPIDTHSHNDVLALTLTAYGRRLLADTSDKSYNNDPISNWQRVSRFSHNVVAIDDISGYQMYQNNWSNPNLKSSADSNFTDNHDILTMQLIEEEMPKGDYVSDRKITFLKPLKFLIVSDHLDAVEGDHKYTQSWIFDPLALPSIDGETGLLRSNFESGANVLVVPDSNADMVQSIEDGYHESTAIEYAKFVKNSGSVETFDTVLYPIKEGEQTQVITDKIDMGDNKLISAMTIEVKKDGNKSETGAYYISHEETPIYRSFGENATDATMAYVNYGHGNKVNYAIVQNATILEAGKDTVIKSDLVLKDLSVEYIDKEINIVSSEKVLANLGNLEILASPNVKVVNFNGVSIPFEKRQGVIYLKEAEKKNLALGKEITGGSQAIVDGDANTSWQQETLEFPHTVTIDLGEAQIVKEVEVLWGLSETQNGVNKFKLQTSTNGSDFTDVEDGRGFERSLIQHDGKVRYIRLVTEGNTFYDPLQIREIYVYEESSIKEEKPKPNNNSGGNNNSSITIEEEDIAEELIGVTFTDLYQASWAKDYIEYLAARKIVEGITENKYGPNEIVSRDVYVTMLVRGCGLVDFDAKTNFEDITSDHEYYQEIASGEKLGITKGIGKSLFGTGQSITREQMATMFMRALEVLDIELKVVKEKVVFSDDVNISEYAKEFVYEMQKAGVLEGIGDGTYAPKETATRAQAAKVIYYLIK